MRPFIRTVVTIGVILLMVIYTPRDGVRTQSGETHPPQAPEVLDEVRQIPHTLEETVTYIRTHRTLPEYYLTKAEAAQRGWRPSEGNLCDVAPEMLIGGDIFTNAQKLLPVAKGRVWYEADFEYTCGTRNAKRILYSNDALIYITTDHYKTVTLVE
jgi:ribonuclease